MFVQRKRNRLGHADAELDSLEKLDTRLIKKEGTTIETKKMSVAIIYGVTSIFII